MSYLHTDFGNPHVFFFISELETNVKINNKSSRSKKINKYFLSSSKKKNNLENLFMSRATRAPRACVREGCVLVELKITSPLVQFFLIIIFVYVTPFYSERDS